MQVEAAEREELFKGHMAYLEQRRERELERERERERERELEAEEAGEKRVRAALPAYSCELCTPAVSAVILT